MAHSNCQQKLDEIWYTGIRKLSKMNKIFVLLLGCLFFAFLPFVSIIYIFAPKSKVGNFMSLPCIKFLSHTFSYAVFICLIVYSSIQFQTEQDGFEKLSKFLSSNSFSSYKSFKNVNQYSKYNFKFLDFYIRQESPSLLDYIIIIFVAGKYFINFLILIWLSDSLS